MWGKLAAGAGTIAGGAMGANMIASNRAVQDGNDNFAGAVGGAAVGVGGMMMANRIHRTLSDPATAAGDSWMAGASKGYRGELQKAKDYAAHVANKASIAHDLEKDGFRALAKAEGITLTERLGRDAVGIGQKMQGSRMIRLGIAGLAGAAIGGLMGVDSY